MKAIDKHKQANRVVVLAEGMMGSVEAQAWKALSSTLFRRPRGLLVCLGAIRTSSVLASCLWSAT